MKKTGVCFFKGDYGGIVVLHSSLSSFIASTRLIRSGVGAIDSPDQPRQGFEQYDTSKKSLKKVLGDFTMAFVKKFSFLVFSKLL